MTAASPVAGAGLPAGLASDADQLSVSLLLAVRAAQQHARDLAAVLAGGVDPLHASAHVSADVLAQVKHLAEGLLAGPDPVARHARDLIRDLAYARDLARQLVTATAAGPAGSGSGGAGSGGAGSGGAGLGAAGLGAAGWVGALAGRLDSDLEYAHALGGDPARAHMLVRRLDGERDSARRLVRQLRPAWYDPPGRLCRFVVTGMVRVLPAAHRSRYAREYAAELWELGVQSAPRCRRAAYALRLGVACWSLRRALRGAAAGRQES